MKARISAALLGGAAAMALIVAGCGGDSAPLTKAAFVEQANSICKQGRRELAAALKEAGSENAQGSGSSSSDAEIEAVVTAVAMPQVQGMIEELSDLNPPKRDRKQVAAVVAGFEEGVEKSEANPGSALDGSAFIVADERAEAYGLTECTI
jgi:hypothetical protein